MQQDYFTKLAPHYHRVTGNTTRTLVDQILQDIRLGINSFSIIHDNGCGVGTVSAAISDYCSARGILPPKIYATDSNEAMINELRVRQSEVGPPTSSSPGWATVKSSVMDSENLTFESDMFGFTFCNITVNTCPNPLRVLQQIQRTLKPAGVAVVTVWKRFGIEVIMKNARQSIKGDAPAGMKQPNAEYTEEGHLAKMMDKADWELGKVKTLQKDVLVKEGSEEMAGLRDFLLGDLTEPARAGWTPEEKSKWPAAVDEAIKGEMQQHGGILFEAWVVLGRKWDAMYA